MDDTPSEGMPADDSHRNGDRGRPSASNPRHEGTIASMTKRTLNSHRSETPVESQSYRKMDKVLRKRVSWAETNRMYLIGGRSEIAALKGELWYNKENFRRFRDDAVEELKDYMRMHGITDADVALETLYQPNELQPLSPLQEEDEDLSSN